MKREGAYITFRVCTITVAAKAGTESTIELNGSTLSYTWEQNTEYLAFDQRSKRIFQYYSRDGTSVRRKGIIPGELRQGN